MYIYIYTCIYDMESFQKSKRTRINRFRESQQKLVFPQVSKRGHDRIPQPCSIALIHKICTYMCNVRTYVYNMYVYTYYIFILIYIYIMYIFIYVCVCVHILCVYIYVYVTYSSYHIVLSAAAPTALAICSVMSSQTWHSAAP